MNIHHTHTHTQTHTHLYIYICMYVCTPHISLQRGKTLPTNVLVMTSNCSIMRLQWCWRIGEFRVLGFSPLLELVLLFLNTYEFLLDTFFVSDILLFKFSESFPGPSFSQNILWLQFFFKFVSPWGCTDLYVVVHLFLLPQRSIIQGVSSITTTISYCNNEFQLHYKEVNRGLQIYKITRSD